MGADIGYRIDNAATGGHFVDMYVSWAALGNPSSLCLIWATDNQDPNLDQAPNLDRPEGTYCISVCVPPRADFHASDTSPCVNETVTFTDDSTGSPTSWSWNFTGGDPASAAGVGPHTVTYDSPGNYTVSLTVTNACGSDIKTQTNYITAKDCIGPIPTVNKTASPDPVERGGTVTYTITVSNIGSANATGVTIVDDYDESVLTIVNAGGGIDDGDTVTWNGGITIPSGGSFSCNITATVSPTATRGSTFYNTANVTCAEEVSDSITIGTTVESEEYEIYLTEIFLLPGWNLISLPGIPEDPAVEAVLADLLTGDCCQEPIDFTVWYYDCGEWYVYDGDSEYQTLTEMDECRAYWIYLDGNDPASFKVKGVWFPPPPGPPLKKCYHECWNMVGYTSRNATMDDNVYVASLTPPNSIYYVLGWNATTQLWVPNPPVLVRGQGYWMAFIQDACFVPPI